MPIDHHNHDDDDDADDDDDDVEDGRYKDNADGGVINSPSSFVSDSSSVDDSTLLDEDTGLMRRSGRSKNKNRRTVRNGIGRSAAVAHYSSIRTNATPPSSSSSMGSKCYYCFGVCCKTILLVASMTLVGIIGFWIGTQQGTSNLDGSSTTTGVSGSGSGLSTPWFRSFQWGSITPVTPSNPSGPSITSMASSVSSMDQKTWKQLQHEAHMLPHDQKRTIKYDPTLALAGYGGGGGGGYNTNTNPFEFTVATPSVITPPQMNFGRTTSSSSSTSSSRPNAYMHHPNLVNNQLAFVSEGDIYITYLTDDVALATNTEQQQQQPKLQPLPAMKLTTTIGNVIDPKFHPTLPYIAYTATYSGRRDVYLMDLRPTSIMTSPMRLTYWDIGMGGVSGLIGWYIDPETNTTSLIFRALSNDVSLPDYRLYQIHLEMGTTTSTTIKEKNKGTDASVLPQPTPSSSSTTTTSVFQIVPVPLSQAIDTVRYNNCWYFVRYKQSSNTIRYVGGTAENLWRYCDGQSTSQRLMEDGYRGTSRDPQLYRMGSTAYLFFLSDRGYNNNNKKEQENDHVDWIPDRMNIWAMKLGTNGKDEKITYSSSSSSVRKLIQITDTACDFEGRTIREYSVDASTGHLVARIGADIYFMDKTTVQSKLVMEEQQNSNRYTKQRRRHRHRYLEESSSPGNATSTPTPTTPETVTLNEVDVKMKESMENVTTTDVESAKENKTKPDNVTTTSVEKSKQDKTKTVKDTDLDDKKDKTDKSGETSTKQVEQNASATDSLDKPANSTHPAEKHDSPASVHTEDATGRNKTNPSTQSPTQPVSDASMSTKNSKEKEPKQADQVADVAIVDDGTDSTEGIVVETEINDGSENVTNDTITDPPPSKYYYDYHQPEFVARKDVDDGDDHITGHSSDLMHLPIAVYSDFATQQERIVPVSFVKHYQFGDVFETLTQSTQMLVTLRGQLWVAPVVDDGLPPYEEAGKNLPARQYRLVPGAMMGGITRVLAAWAVPNPVEDDISDRRLAVVLATDPLTETAEHAFYLIETQPGSTPLFVNMENLPKPFLGGIVSGGSTRDGGLGSVKPNTLAMSPCGNRMAWSDTDGRIVVMNMPQYQDFEGTQPPAYTILPKTNEMGESMVGDEVNLVFSPGGRYLSVEHNARNQFRVLSIVDLGDPLAVENKIADISVGRIVQATPARFNSQSAYWGQSTTDMHDFAREQSMAQIFGLKEPDDVSTTLYFLSDRDITTDVSSPWGYRQPMPHFVDSKAVFALPLREKDSDRRGQFPGGGVEELHVRTILERQKLLESMLNGLTMTSADRRKTRKLAEDIHPLAGAFGLAERSFRESKMKGSNRRRLDGANGDAFDLGQNETDSNVHLKEAVFPMDMDIDFGPLDLSFARHAYRVANIPEGNYQDILCQIPGDGTLVVIEDLGGVDGNVVNAFMPESFPSDQYSSNTFKATSRKLGLWTLSSSRKHFVLVFLPDGATRVVPNTLSGLSQLFGDSALDYNVVDKVGLHMSVWPSLEYTQLYNDAWRMLRDYFYDPDMTGIDWPAIHERYLPLVQRCRKREELDDVLIQMAAELSALHVFVYGGEYESPLHDDSSLTYANEVGSLGASLQRNVEWKGYVVTSIPEHDPDFTMIDQSTSIYSPLSEQSLRLSGQRGLQVGDVIVGVNGESVMTVPDIHMLLRGTAGKSIRLDVLRLASGIDSSTIIDADDGNDARTKNRTIGEATIETVITVPLDPDAAGDLLYHAWEWKTEQLAHELASNAGISVGYVHLQSMSSASAEDAFARGFFPNYHKQGLILDVRHNLGGNIDAWVLDVLQRKPWMYWQSRDFDPTNGGIGWDEHFAFRGHIVVLLDEKTSSDGEGVSRGIAELGLGRLIGTRTWGGGIWLSSDNHLVDGGIATAPEIGTYNEHLTWGLGVEQMGVDPDIVVDNDPHETFTGMDRQLERAVAELKKWIEEEPVVLPPAPTKKKDMTMGDRECTA